MSMSETDVFMDCLIEHSPFSYLRAAAQGCAAVKDALNTVQLNVIYFVLTDSSEEKEQLNPTIHLSTPCLSIKSVRDSIKNESDK